MSSVVVKDSHTIFIGWGRANEGELGTGDVLVHCKQCKREWVVTGIGDVSTFTIYCSDRCYVVGTPIPPTNKLVPKEPAKPVPVWTGRKR